MNTSRRADNGMKLLNNSKILFAGLMLGVLIAVDGISFGFLVYSDSLHQYLLYGISANLVGSGILLIAVALFSSSRYSIASTQDIFAVNAALVAMSVTKTMQQNGSVEEMLGTVVCAIAIMALLMGLAMYFLGVARLGKLVRFIPYPVIGGFLAGTGWLILSSTFGSLTATYSIMDTARHLWSGEHYLIWLLPGIYGLMILLAESFIPSTKVFPVMVILGFLVFYGYLLISGISLEQAGNYNWMMGPFPEGHLRLFPNSALGFGVQWGLLGQYIGEFFAVSVLGIISLLLNVSSFEMSSKQSMDVNRELKITGLANVVSSLFGGFGGYQVLSFSKTNLNFRVATRWVGVLAGFVCLATLFVGTGFLTCLPRFIFSALLIYIGLEFMVAWMISIKHKISWLDYLIVLSIVVIIAIFGLLVGILVGLLLSLAIFFFRYSRIPVIASMVSGQILHSNVERNEFDKAILEQFGNNLLIVSVRGYLFFGNVYEMISSIVDKLNDIVEVKHQGEKGRPIYDSIAEKNTYLIINFRHATGIEVSGTIGFVNLLHYTRKRHITVLFTGLPENISGEIQRFAASEHEQLPFMNVNDLDHALEWCENRLLMDHCAIPHDLIQLFTMSFPGIEQAQTLLKYADKLEFKKNDVVCHEGEQSKELFWLAEGELEVIVAFRTGNAKRLRRIRAGAIVGEMGLYLNEPRSASVVAANRCLMYRFTSDVLKTLMSEQPELAALFHKSIVKVLAKRLMYANRLLSSNALTPDMDTK
ncbi:SulP family inorganic anion transporter [Legionella spiritensis]|nr:SulP family inorganic anion transporter [Legionella spiritensis]